MLKALSTASHCASVKLCLISRIESACDRCQDFIAFRHASRTCPGCLSPTLASVVSTEGIHSGRPKGCEYTHAHKSSTLPCKLELELLCTPVMPSSITDGSSSFSPHPRSSGGRQSDDAVRTSALSSAFTRFKMMFPVRLYR